MPCSAFRNALISACRTAGFVMTRAKLALFVEADGYDEDGTPLVYFTKGEPHKHIGYARNQTGVADIRSRPMWNPGWEATVRVRFDGDMFTPTDVANLMVRVGQQVGIGEGRPDSKQSAPALSPSPPTAAPFLSLDRVSRTLRTRRPNAKARAVITVTSR